MIETIKTWDEVKQFCDEYEKEEQKEYFWEKLFNAVDFSSEELKRFTVEIHGNKFHSSITAGYAQAIIDFQDRFYKVLKTLDTGKVPTRKSTNIPQMFFTISEGCSKIQSDDLPKEMPSNIREFGKLDTKSQLIVAFIIIVYIVSGNIGGYFSKEIESIEKIDLAKIQLEDKISERENLQKLLASEKFKTTIAYAKESGVAIRSSIIKNTPVDEVDSIKLPTETISKTQIIDEQRKNPIEKTAEIKTLDFKVLNLSGSFSTQKLKARVQLIEDPKLVITLSSELLDEDTETNVSDDDEEHLLQESDMDILWEAQKHNKTVSVMGNFFYDENKNLIRGVMWSASAKEY